MRRINSLFLLNFITLLISPWHAHAGQILTGNPPAPLTPTPPTNASGTFLLQDPSYTDLTIDGPNSTNASQFTASIGGSAATTTNLFGTTTITNGARVLFDGIASQVTSINGPLFIWDRTFASFGNGCTFNSTVQVSGGSLALTNPSRQPINLVDFRRGQLTLVAPYVLDRSFNLFSGDTLTFNSSVDFNGNTITVNGGILSVANPATQPLNLIDYQRGILTLSGAYALDRSFNLIPGNTLNLDQNASFNGNTITVDGSSFTARNPVTQPLSLIDYQRGILTLSGAYALDRSFNLIPGNTLNLDQNASFNGNTIIVDGSSFTARNPVTQPLSLIDYRRGSLTLNGPYALDRSFNLTSGNTLNLGQNVNLNSNTIIVDGGSFLAQNPVTQPLGLIDYRRGSLTLNGAYALDRSFNLTSGNTLTLDQNVGFSSNSITIDGGSLTARNPVTQPLSLIDYRRGSLSLFGAYALDRNFNLTSGNTLTLDQNASFNGNTITIDGGALSAQNPVIQPWNLIDYRKGALSLTGAYTIDRDFNLQNGDSLQFLSPNAVFTGSNIILDGGTIGIFSSTTVPASKLRLIRGSATFGQFYDFDQQLILTENLRASFVSGAIFSGPNIIVDGGDLGLSDPINQPWQRVDYRRGVLRLSGNYSINNDFALKPDDQITFNAAVSYNGAQISIDGGSLSLANPTTQPLGKVTYNRGTLNLSGGYEWSDNKTLLRGDSFDVGAGAQLTGLITLNGGSMYLYSPTLQPISRVVLNQGQLNLEGGYELIQDYNLVHGQRLRLVNSRFNDSFITINGGGLSIRNPVTQPLDHVTFNSGELTLAGNYNLNETILNPNKTLSLISSFGRPTLFGSLIMNGGTLQISDSISQPLSKVKFDRGQLILSNGSYEVPQGMALIPNQTLFLIGNATLQNQITVRGGGLGLSNPDTQPWSQVNFKAGGLMVYSSTYVIEQDFIAKQGDSLALISTVRFAQAPLNGKLTLAGGQAIISDYTTIAGPIILESGELFHYYPDSRKVFNIETLNIAPSNLNSFPSIVPVSGLEDQTYNLNNLTLNIALPEGDYKNLLNKRISLFKTFNVSQFNQASLNLMKSVLTIGVQTLDNLKPMTLTGTPKLVISGGPALNRTFFDRKGNIVKILPGFFDAQGRPVNAESGQIANVGFEVQSGGTPFFGAYESNQSTATFGSTLHRHLMTGPARNATNTSAPTNRFGFHQTAKRLPAASRDQLSVVAKQLQDQGGITRSTKNLSMWVDGAHQRGTTKAMGQLPRIKNKFNGVFLGGEYALSHTSQSIGAVVGFGRGKERAKGESYGTRRSRSGYVSLYHRISFFEHARLDTYGAFEFKKSHAKRRIKNLSGNIHPKSHSKTKTGLVGSQMSYGFEMGATNLRPYYGLEYSRSRRGHFHEHNAGDFALRYDSLTLKSASHVAGLFIDHKRNFGEFAVNFMADAMMSHAFKEPKGHSHVHLKGSSGHFKVRVPSPGKRLFAPMVGVELSRTNHTWRIGLRGGGEYRKKQKSHYGLAELKWVY